MDGSEMPMSAPAGGGRAESAPLLQMRGITQQFPGVKALDGVDFTLRRGEIHALMGQNGAGKSTLIKALTGVNRRSAGTILVEGRHVDPRSPKEAEAVGISTVYQEVNLIPHLSVAENICLGREPMRWGTIQWRKVRQRAEAALERLELKLDVSQELASCSIAIQQMVALARAMDVQAKLLILDEPTSSLDADEVAELFAVMRKLRDQGLGIVFVTHFLDQVYAVSDRITVLRDGRLVGEYEAAKLSRQQLVSAMIGKEFAPERNGTARASEAKERRPTFLAAEKFGRRGSIAPLDVHVDAGEVLGLAGLLGSGRTELARVLFGVDKADSGQMKINGKAVSLHSPRQAIAAGLAFTPENRKTDGIIPHLSVRENIVLALQARQGIWRKLSGKRQLELADEYIRVLGIKTSGPEQPIATLSGGNQQKVLLARWLVNKPKLLILDEPTRGIDVGAKAEIEKLMRRLGEEGMSIVFISSELEEVARSCDRVLVLRDRRKVGELAGAEVEQGRIMELIAKDDNDE